ncbi:MAG: DUF4428 domain-containing protein [Mogibacterium sp.]|nr:DUF4428 domain-containing protein [Mogibacterium sp.]
MGLFDMKFCAICGNEIGLLGKKKVEDGIICKDCVAKLSPWFTERKKSTVAEIEQQLEYRKRNSALLKSFNPTQSYGNRTKIYLDERLKKFIVTRSSNWRNSNPDLIELKDVQNCDVLVSENKEEIYDQQSDGKRVSYNPKRYRYDYTFRVRLGIRSEYFPEICFELSDKKPDSVESALYKKYDAQGKVIQAALMPGKYSVSAETVALANTEIKENTDGTVTTTVPISGSTVVSATGSWTCECGQINEGNFCSNCGKPRPTRWFCPDCGKENHGKFCVSCGRAKPE